MQGVFGKYLDVNLTTGEIKGRQIPDEWYRLHLGGRGIAARLLLELVPPGTDAYAPENALVFATGPFQGTGLAGAGRHVLMSVSPKTGSIACSYVGGYLGHELGRSGYDGVVFHGRSSEPVYLVLSDGQAELRPADEMWGSPTLEVDRQLKERHPGVRVACIGPAGERQVQMACVIHDVNRSAGRPGLGAVMGSKRLKALAVKGHVDKPLADKETFTRLRASFGRALAENKGAQRLGQYGTAGGLTALNETGLLPTQNFREGVFDQAEDIGGERMADTILTERETCTGCPVRCKRVVQTTFAGQQVDPAYGGPEYETLGALGSLCGVSDLSAVALGNQLCNAYGLDTISAGVAVATLMEASERGLISESVAWGDPQALVTWIRRIGERQGLGDDIAQGLDSWARSVGADYVMTVKGVELPMHEPRGKVGLGLSYAISPRGATHMEGTHDTMLEKDSPTPELGVDQPVDRFQVEDKASIAVLYENLRSFNNSLVMCVFTTPMSGPAYNFPQLRELLQAATGESITAQGMLEIGARNFDLLRLYSSHCGYRSEHDRLPDRLHEPLPRGASANRPIDREAFRQEIDRYYELRGWDDSGPTDQRLRQAGLAEVADKLCR
ncbi:MAG: aldehyde ferredoxin oxidoreductase family protein [Candidatus Bipolaricaulota bacterium]